MVAPHHPKAATAAGAFATAGMGKIDFSPLRIRSLVVRNVEKSRAPLEITFSIDSMYVYVRLPLCQMLPFATDIQLGHTQRWWLANVIDIATKEEANLPSNLH